MTLRMIRGLVFGLACVVLVVCANAVEVSLPEAHGDVNAAVLRVVAAGGGRVVVPKGNWPTPSVKLASNVELFLADGARIVASTNRSDYMSLNLPYCEGDLMAIVTAVGVTNVAITGRGEIFGNGMAVPNGLFHHANGDPRSLRAVFTKATGCSLLQWRNRKE